MDIKTPHLLGVALLAIGTLIQQRKSSDPLVYATDKAAKYTIDGQALEAFQAIRQRTSKYSIPISGYVVSIVDADLYYQITTTPKADVQSRWSARHPGMTLGDVTYMVEKKSKKVKKEFVFPD